jgi:hypothetical protein
MSASTTKPTAPKPTAPKATAPKAMKYETAVARARKVMAAVNRSNWTLGDIALAVETVTYGEGTIQRLADDISVDYKSLLNMRTVSKAYATSDRSENSWTVHMVFAGQKDRAELVKAQTWTVSAARALVVSRNAPAETVPAGDSDETDPVAPETDELELARLNVARLEGELIKARAHLATLEEKLAPKPAIMHTPAGIPAHVPSDNRPDCKLCKIAAKAA